MKKRIATYLTYIVIAVFALAGVIQRAAVYHAAESSASESAEEEGTPQEKDDSDTGSGQALDASGSGSLKPAVDETTVDTPGDSGSSDASDTTGGAQEGGASENTNPDDPNAPNPSGDDTNGEGGENSGPSGENSDAGEENQIGENGENIAENPGEDPENEKNEGDAGEGIENTGDEKAENEGETGDSGEEGKTESKPDDKEKKDADAGKNEAIRRDLSLGDIRGETGSNLEMIAAQAFENLPEYEEDFRFSHIDAQAIVFVTEGFVYESERLDSRKVGSFPEGAKGVLLAEGSLGWLYVESGVVRGFVPKDAVENEEEVVVIDTRAEMDARQGSARRLRLLLGERGEAEIDPEDAEEAPRDKLSEITRQMQTFQSQAWPLVNPVENAALAHTKTTAREPVVEKVYAIALADIEIFEGKPGMTYDTEFYEENEEEYEQENKVLKNQNAVKKIGSDNADSAKHKKADNTDSISGTTRQERTENGSIFVKDVKTEDLLAVEEAEGAAEEEVDEGIAEFRVVGRLCEGGLCYILDDRRDGWLYVESGDVRGFVAAKDVLSGEDANKAVEEKGEDAFAAAEEVVEAKENRALYYTITSTQEARKNDVLRNEIVSYATQFVGKLRYVWGGTSLVTGADCSGFVQSIYKKFGYTIPRIAQDQAHSGMKVRVKDARPADLIFYASGGYIYHVVMYIGDGRTVEAMGDEYGTVIADVNQSDAVWAVSVLGNA